ncbi:MAG: ABC transporter ATP-binding protein [Nitrospinae bacterium CG11_big_fil_rev_8_21_14_0_20_45_15]|nr:MAG: ABC transporter ATP-binding protein [Nitrospinae bacterium CG11_big_fil_rev_8_21_14_0_20_45_15]
MTPHVPTLRKNLALLGSFLNQERSIILPVITYAIAVALFSLIIPITVQELVNTFAFSVSPVMVVTLVGIMAGMLFIVGIFKVLQFYASDIVERRVFVRLVLHLARVLPRYKENTFQSNYINRFFETVFLQRAISGLFIDLINVVVGGLIGMMLLALYHPFFIVFDMALIFSILMIAVLGKGGLRRTIYMSEAKYEVFHWFQEVADNFFQFKATNCADYILRKADGLAADYVQARKSRFSVLLRQYMGSLILQVILHTALLGTAGWLLSQGELTLGQLVAAEVIIASLLVKIDSVVKRSYVIYYFFTALSELDHLFALPKDRTSEGLDISIPKSDTGGLHIKLTQWNGDKESEPSSREFSFEAAPGQTLALISPTESARHRLSRTLAGLEQAPKCVVHYNGVDIKNVSSEKIKAERGIVFGRDFSLFEGTIAENIIMGRPGIVSKDLLWALDLTQLNEYLEGLPLGLETPVQEGSRGFTPSQNLRVLLARAIITRPPLLILDGGLHEIPREIREPLLHRLCSKDCPWTLIIVTTDPNAKKFVETTLSVSDFLIRS